MEDLEWYARWENGEYGDYKSRPLGPFGRYLLSFNGTVRKPVALLTETGRLQFQEAVKAGRPCTPVESSISVASWRKFTDKAVFLPKAWAPGDVVPLNRFRVAHDREKARKEEENRARWAAQAETNARIDAERAKVKADLERHFLEEQNNTEYMLISTQNRVIDQRHFGHYNQKPRAKNWIARTIVDRSIPGGLDREFLNRVPSNWGCYRVDPVRVGDYLEIGADDISHSGNRNPDRVYYRVLDLYPGTMLVHRIPSTPPLAIDEIAIGKEMEIFSAWLANLPGRAEEFEACISRAQELI